jgi:hypothetical protein
VQYQNYNIKNYTHRLKFIRPLENLLVIMVFRKNEIELNTNVPNTHAHII